MNFLNYSDALIENTSVRTATDEAKLGGEVECVRLKVYTYSC
jgi:hypothetical protein